MIVARIRSSIPLGNSWD